MDVALTSRQAQILKVLIDEYIDSAEPIGSEVLERKYNLGVSSATVRNEMVQLTKAGYLKQPHTSSGRVPTPKAMKFYIGQLMEEKQMSLTDEVKAKEEVWDSRGDLDKLIDEATHSLAQRTRTLSVAVLDDGRSWHAGMANIFENPEFSDMTTCANIFSFIEQAKRLSEFFISRYPGSTSVEVFFGEDFNWPGLEPVGIATTYFNARGHQGAFGVIGPVRLRFPMIIPVLRYYGSMIEDVSR